MKDYLDPRSVTRLTGFAMIGAGVALAAAPAWGTAEWVLFAKELAGGVPPAVLIANGTGLLGIRAAIAKAGK